VTGPWNLSFTDCRLGSGKTGALTLARRDSVLTYASVVEAYDLPQVCWAKVGDGSPPRPTGRTALC
jgi:hypothetical protein